MTNSDKVLLDFYFRHKDEVLPLSEVMQETGLTEDEVVSNGLDCAHYVAYAYCRECVHEDLSTKLIVSDLNLTDSVTCWLCDTTYGYFDFEKRFEGIFFGHLEGE